MNSKSAEVESMCNCQINILVYISLKINNRGETNMARALTHTLYLNDRVTEYNLQKFSA